MRFIKCPRCELNYIREEEEYCSVCKREMRGEKQDEPVELCSVCNENPVMPGKDVCYACYKEMTQRSDLEPGDDNEAEEAEVGVEMEEVGEMEEIDLGDLPEDVPPEIGTQISLEEERAREEEENEEDEEEDL